MSNGFSASEKYKLKIASALNGGVTQGLSKELVVCDIDMQPHFKDAHPPGRDGRISACQNPVKWTTKGIKIEDSNLW